MAAGSGGALAAPTASKQAEHGDVFIEVGPVDAFAVADQAPVAAFSRAPIAQAGESGEWNGELATIVESHLQHAVGECHLGGERLGGG